MAFPHQVTMAQSSQSSHPQKYTTSDQFSHPRAQDLPLDLTTMGQFYPLPTRYLPQDCGIIRQHNIYGNLYHPLPRTPTGQLTTLPSTTNVLHHGQANQIGNRCLPMRNTATGQFNQAGNQHIAQNCFTQKQLNLPGNKFLSHTSDSKGKINEERNGCPPLTSSVFPQFNQPINQFAIQHCTTMVQSGNPRLPLAYTSVKQLNQPRPQCPPSNNTTMGQLNQPRPQCPPSNNTFIGQFNKPRAQCPQSYNTAISQLNQLRAKCPPSTMGQFSRTSNQYISMNCTPTNHLNSTGNPYIPQTRTTKRTFHQMSQVPHLRHHTYQPIPPSGIPVTAHASPVQPKRHNATHLPWVYAPVEEISQSQSPRFSTADFSIRHDVQRVSPDPHLPESSVEQVMQTNLSVTPLVIQPQYETSQIASSTSGQLNSATTLTTGIVMYSDEQSNLSSATRRQSDLGDSRDPHLPKTSLDQVMQTNISVTSLIIQPQYETSQIESSVSGMLNSATTATRGTGMYSDEKSNFSRASFEVKMDDELSSVLINVDKLDPTKHSNSYHACSECGSLFLTESNLSNHDCIGTIVKNENETDEQISRIVPAVTIQSSAKQTICVNSQDLSRCIMTASEDCTTSSFTHAQVDLISHAAKCTNDFLNFDSQTTCPIDWDRYGLEQDKTGSEARKSVNNRLELKVETSRSVDLKSVASKHAPTLSFVQANHLNPLLNISKTNLTGKLVLNGHDDTENASKCLREDGENDSQTIVPPGWSARSTGSDYLEQGSGESTQSIMNNSHGIADKILESSGPSKTLAKQSKYKSIDQTTIVLDDTISALGSSQLLSELEKALDRIPVSLRFNSCNDGSSQRVADVKTSNADAYSQSIVSIPVALDQTLSGVGAAKARNAVSKVTDGVANSLVQTSYSRVPVQSCAGDNANSLVLNSGNCGNEGHTLSAIGATQAENTGNKADEGMAATLLLNNDACDTVESIGRQLSTPLNNRTTINTHTLPSDLSDEPSQMMGCKACHVLFSSTSEFESHDCEASVLWLSDEGSFNGSVPGNPRCFHDKKRSSINWMWKTPDYPVHESQTGVWKCNYCDMVCPSRMRLVFHFQYVHRKIISFCPYCLTCIAKKSKMRRHMCQRHSGCRSCPELQFKTLADVTAHCNSAKHRMKRPFLCHLCGKGLSTPESLRLHMRDACDTVESFGRQLSTPLNNRTTINTHTLPSDLSDEPSQMMGCKACHVLFSSTSEFESHDCEASVLWLSDEGTFNGSIPENPRCFHDKKRSSITWLWKTPDYPVYESQTGSWKCYYCDKVCHSRIQLVFHFQYVHRKIYSFCPYCLTCIKKTKLLVRHMCQRHSGCRSCPELQFETLDDVTAHCNSAKHRMKRPFLCHLCGKGLSDPKALRIHMRYHKNDSFSCPICPMKFRYLKQIEPHTRQVHAKCKECDVGFGSLKSLKIHCRELRHRIAGAFKCDDCDNTFISKYNRKLHCSHVHKKEKKFSCTECDSSFIMRNGLDIHYIRKHGHKPTASCSICGKGFSNKDQLENHMASHSDNRPFQCDICGKSFKLSQHLTQHSVTHATDNDEDRPYKCHLCEKGFKLPHHLRQHASTHQTAESRSGDDKLCDKCGQYYKRDHKKCSKRPQKKQHEKQLSSGDHGTVSPTQSCFLCSHQVADSDEMLSGHLKNYHLVAESCRDISVSKTCALVAGKPMACTKCDVKFNSRIPLNAHLRKCQVMTDYTKHDDYLSINRNHDECDLQPSKLPSETQMDGTDAVLSGDCMNTFPRGDCHCPLCKKITSSVHHLKVHLIQQHWMTESDVIDFMQGKISINDCLL